MEPRIFRGVRVRNVIEKEAFKLVLEDLKLQQRTVWGKTQEKENSMSSKEQEAVLSGGT